jgi:ATP-dependent DNA helicase RecG
MDKTNFDLSTALSLGEGQTIEFKESISKLDKEIVAFANASGGTIFCGISDVGEIVGTDISNSTRSQIQDIGRNCDPSIPLRIEVLPEKVLKIEVEESSEKPHQCSGGFYLRVGASSQKLKVSEVKNLLSNNQNFFDSRINNNFEIKKDFSEDSYSNYCGLCNIKTKRNKEEVLEGLSVIKKVKGNSKFAFNNAGVLLFSKNPKELIPESYLTAVRYAGVDKFSILDRRDFNNGIIEQIEAGLDFVKKHISVEYEISGAGKRLERYTYPLVAIREALINSLVHRDYSFQNSCVYLNIYSDRIEIENPGGIYGHVEVSGIEGRSIRRNPLLSDLLYRAGYGEKLGSGLLRIKESLKENGNPNYQISNTNFFVIRFLPRVSQSSKVSNLSSRQLEILNLLNNFKRDFNSRELAQSLNASPTTITRDLKILIDNGLIKIKGEGRAIRYSMIVNGDIK